MTPRQRWVVLGSALTATAAGAARLADGGGIGATVKAALAGLLAAAVMALAASLLTRSDWRGVVVGGCFVGAGLLSWTHTERPILVWTLLLIEGIVFAWWSRFWLRHVPPATRLGTAWLGVGYWLLGVVGALLVAHWQVAAQRLAYAGVFGLVVLAVLTRSRLADLSAGVAAAFVFALGAMLLAGSGNVFEATHVVPANEWGMGLAYRFWGGDLLLYQPNSMAALAGVAAIRVGVDVRFLVWQRLSVTALAGFVVYLTHSRTGWVILAGAAMAHAAMLWWRSRRPVAELPRYGGARRTVTAAAVPLLISGLVVLGWQAPDVTPSGEGTTRPALTEGRYADGGVTSGRWDTWQQVFTEWREDGVAEKLFGDATTTRAVVKRESSGDAELTTDNAAVGALRRGGVLGVAAFVVGLGLLLWHAYRRDAPAWFVVAVLASLPPIMTSDALLGGTGGTVWVLLLAGEAALLFGARGAGASGVSRESQTTTTPETTTVHRQATQRP